METENIKQLQNSFIEKVNKLTKNVSYSKEDGGNWITIELKIPKFNFYFNIAERGLFDVFLNKITEKLFMYATKNEIKIINNKSELITILNKNKPYTIYDTILLNSEIYNKLLIADKIKKHYFSKEFETILDISGYKIFPVTDNYPHTIKENILIIDSSKIAIVLFGDKNIKFDISENNDSILLQTKFKIENYDIINNDSEINSILKINLTP
jgi:hypothetical protein